jgi:hypothetical protein
MPGFVIAASGTSASTAAWLGVVGSANAMARMSAVSFFMVDSLGG